jgi:hypothetical protein
MLYRPRFTYITATTAEQRQAQEAAANEEWRKKLIFQSSNPFSAIGSLFSRIVSNIANAVKNAENTRPLISSPNYNPPPITFRPIVPEWRPRPSFSPPPFVSPPRPSSFIYHPVTNMPTTGVSSFSPPPNVNPHIQELTIKPLANTLIGRTLSAIQHTEGRPVVSHVELPRRVLRSGDIAPGNGFSP